MSDSREYDQSQYKSWESFYKLGNSLLKCQQWETAALAYHQAIILNPGIDWLYYYLAEALIKQEKWEEAVKAYQSAMALNSNLPLIHRKLAYALHQRAIIDRKTGLDFFLQQIEQDPNDLQNYHKAIELQPHHVNLYLGLSSALLKQGQLKQAFIILQIASQIKSNNSEVILRLERLSRIITRWNTFNTQKNLPGQCDTNCKRILFIEDTVPHPCLGAGYGRSHNILNGMVDLGFAVTLYPGNLSYLSDTDELDVYCDVPESVEIIIDYGLAHLEKFLRDKRDRFDIVFVSRPHNIERLTDALSRISLLPSTKIIYDAEALYCSRDLVKRKLHGEHLPLEHQQTSMHTELNLARISDCIVTVSKQEKQKFIEHGYSKVSVMGHTFSPSPTPNSFYQRRDVLFVGAIHEPKAPNTDSILWFSQDILHLIQAKLEQKIHLLIAGKNTIEYLKNEASLTNNSSIQILGYLNKLTSLYDHARLFVAPTRFAAGIPYKVHEAAAHGLPVVTTPLIANQLGWQHEVNLLVADTSKEFAMQCTRLYEDQALWNRLRSNALKQIEVDCSKSCFLSTLEQVLQN